MVIIKDEIEIAQYLNPARNLFDKQTKFEALSDSEELSSVEEYKSDSNESNSSSEEHNHNNSNDEM